LSLSEEGLRKLLESLVSESNVVAPVRKNGFFQFDMINNVKELSFEYSNTRLPPKRFLLPQREIMFKYDPANETVKTQIPEGSLILFGMRPCDASALSMLDKIMLNLPYADPFYETRRKSMTVISLSCTRPMPECFCNVFGTGPLKGLGEDLTLTPLRGVFLTEVRTMKGLVLVESFRGLFDDADDNIVREYENISNTLLSEMNSRIKVDVEKIKNLEYSVNEDFLQLEAQRCVECSLCSYTCPVCYCFETEDFLEENTYVRARGWDTCISQFFTRMASGLDPRITKTDRLCHRFCHKLSRIPSAFKAFGCVGCGRCVSLCPTGVDIREVLRKWG
jgi:formate hydrogenlyase subunit 6/NADH:ubiquinone oxidoreductase subunit I